MGCRQGEHRHNGDRRGDCNGPRHLRQRRRGLRVSAPSVTIANKSNVFIASPFGTSPMVTRLSATTGAPKWYMCNTNGPYYFSDLSAFAFVGDHLWVASRSGANNPFPDAATGSLTELYTTSGALITTLPTT